jgi:membrane protein DedA with SNARE-associated domain
VDFLNSDTVQHLIGNYGYGAIFVIVMLESAGIPMPGETILVTATAYAATKHTLDIRWVIAAAAGGAILGDNIGFWVGREFGEPLLIRLDTRLLPLALYPSLKRARIFPASCRPESPSPSDFLYGDRNREEIVELRGPWMSC